MIVNGWYPLFHLEVFTLDRVIKSLLTVALAVSLLLCATALAEGYYVELPSKGITATTKISVTIPDENPAQEGINPLTGEAWYGRYTPIIANLDMDPDGWPFFGTSAADIIYELPLHGEGHSRGAVVFLSEFPTRVGPIRSARVPMASIREMWDAAYVFHGRQNGYNGNEIDVDVDRWVLRLHEGAFKGSKTEDGGRFYFPFVDGYTDSYNLFSRVTGDRSHVSPHNSVADLTLVQSLFTGESTKHPFKFTDTGLDHGTDVNAISIVRRTGNTFTSTYVFNPYTHLYDYYRNDQLDYDANNNMTLSFANVIFVRTNVTWYNNNASRPVVQLHGQGTAEIFQNGKYIRGTWVRSNSSSNADEVASQSYRMVFLDDNGEELEMMVGKTYIQIVNNDTPVLVSTSDEIPGSIVRSTPRPTATPGPTREPRATRTPKTDGDATPAPVEVKEDVDEEFVFGG